MAILGLELVHRMIAYQRLGYSEALLCAGPLLRTFNSWDRVSFLTLVCKAAVVAEVEHLRD